MKEELHEFIELHNRGEQPIQMHNWRLTSDSKIGRVDFTFPEGTLLDRDSYLIVAKNSIICFHSFNFEKIFTEARFLDVYPDVPSQMVIGDYRGELANGDCRLVLSNDNGEAEEYVQYGDTFPWPVGTHFTWYPLGCV
jgi:hypothetical protein